MVTSTITNYDCGLKCQNFTAKALKFGPLNDLQTTMLVRRIEYISQCILHIVTYCMCEVQNSRLYAWLYKVRSSIHFLDHLAGICSTLSFLVNGSLAKLIIHVINYKSSN